MQYSNARYEVYICDSTGARVAPLNDADTNQFISMRIVRSLGVVGACTITFTGGAQQPSFLPLLERYGALKKDVILEIWRTSGRIRSLLLDTVWFVRTVTRSMNENGVITITIVAQDTLYLLSSRVCLDLYSLHPGEQNQLVYTGTISEIMSQLVYENNALSYAAYNRTIPNFRTDLVSFNDLLDPAISPSGEISIDVTKRNLLEALQQLSNMSISYRIPIYFDVVASAADSFMFQLYPNQRGIDRRAIDGDGSAAIIGSTTGVIREITTTVDWTDEVTAIIPWGQNGSNTFGFVTDPIFPVTAFATPYSWREAVSDSSTNTSADAQQVAIGELNNRRGTWNISATLQETSDFLFGQNWSYGDRVYINAFGNIVDTRISAIEITVENKQEIIRIALSTTENVV